MIISKNNLQAVMMTRKDKHIPVLDNVFLASDGSTVGSAGNAILAVSPVQPGWKKNIPIKELGEIGEDGVSLSSEAVKDVLKMMPIDKQFKGLLEHCDVAEHDRDIEFTFTDGKRNRTMRGRKYDGKYIPYKKAISDSLEKRAGMRMVFNRARLHLLLEALDKVCPDTSSLAPVWVEFTEDERIIVRGINNANGQRAIGVMQAYQGGQGKWLEPDEWEKSFIRRRRRRRKVNKRRRRD